MVSLKIPIPFVFGDPGIQTTGPQATNQPFREIVFQMLTGKRVFPPDGAATITRRISPEEGPFLTCHQFS